MFPPNFEGVTSLDPGRLLFVRHVLESCTWSAAAAELFDEFDWEAEGMEVSPPDWSSAHLSAQQSCISIRHLSGGQPRPFHCRYVAVLRNLCVHQNDTVVFSLHCSTVRIPHQQRPTALARLFFSQFLAYARPNVNGGLGLLRERNAGQSKPLKGLTPCIVGNRPTPHERTHEQELSTTQQIQLKHDYPVYS